MEQPDDIKDDPEFAPNYIARQMAKKQLEMEEQGKQREIQRSSAFASLIDPSVDYSNTLDDFIEEVGVYHPSRSGIPYLQFLRSNKKKYGNSSSYYRTWGGSPAKEKLGDEHWAIFNFISEELKEKSKKTILSIQDNTEDQKQDLISPNGWIGEDNVRRILFDELIFKGLIAEQADYSKFFIGKTQWLGKGTALFDLIIKLQEKDYVRKKSTLNEILKFYFISKKGTSYSPNSVNTSLSKQNPVSDLQLIDSILEKVSGGKAR